MSKSKNHPLVSTAHERMATPYNARSGDFWVMTFFQIFKKPMRISVLVSYRSGYNTVTFFVSINIKDMKVENSYWLVDNRS